MCGICGIAYRDTGRTVAPELLGRMTEALHHRGPDEGEARVFGNVGVGHRRLSIVDLSGGHQPMANEDDSVWVSYNGEIYNHLELRSALREHRFKTKCDTEVIVHAYEEYGAEGSAARFRGMFAYSVWDERRRRLVLARDRVGIKPLYYHLTASGDLIFASEPAALLVHPDVPRGLSDVAVPEFFAQGRVSGDRTLFRGIRRLPPGHVLEWQDGEVRIAPFADEDPPVADEMAGRDPREVSEEFWSRLCDSVRDRMMADVPIGVFLSGGLDSSLLLAAVEEIGHPALAAFSVGYDYEAEDEIPFAAVVAETYGSSHSIVRIDETDFFGELEQLTRKMGHPLAFSASAPLFHVSKLARDAGVKVVLAGEGADELFAGYGRYPKGLTNYRLARRLDRWLPRSGRSLLRRLAHGAGGSDLAGRLQRSFLARSGTVEDAYLDPFGVFRAEHRRRLLPDVDPGHALDRYTDALSHDLMASNPLEALLRLDQRTYLLELLAKQDHMSMAASIESRVPFLDHDFVRWARTVPASFKLEGSVGKALLKRAARTRLPDRITDAPKRGFLTPIGRWFAPGGPARDMLLERLPSRSDGVDPAYLRTLLDEHARGRDHGERLWVALSFQLWRSEFLDAELPSASRPATRVSVSG